jgi:hypothetical protein
MTYCILHTAHCILHTAYDILHTAHCITSNAICMTGTNLYSLCPLYPLSATGALAMASSGSIDDTGIIFVGLYVMIFALIVFLYEVSQLLKVCTY